MSGFQLGGRKTPIGAQIRKGRRRERLEESEKERDDVELEASGIKRQREVNVPWREEVYNTPKKGAKTLTSISRRADKNNPGIAKPQGDLSRGKIDPQPKRWNVSSEEEKAAAWRRKSRIGSGRGVRRARCKGISQV